MKLERLTSIQRLKISCISSGISITKDAEQKLSDGGKVPLTIHEYVTTGGITLELEGGIFVNAPIDEWYCDTPEAILAIDKNTGDFIVQFRGDNFRARALPLPGYLNVRDSKGNLVIDTAMSHADRLRISPIYGCSFRCEFCDFHGKKYTCRAVDQIIEGLTIARQDKCLPIKHVMISGGTPSARDYGYIDDIYETVIRNTDIPVDVMMAPRKDDIIDRLADWGIHGYSINMEVYDDDIASRLTPQKHRLGHQLFASNIERAVQRVGNQGRVRSLILVGLEPEEKTLEGVEFLAKLGCDPVLSPFRPAPGTSLGNVRPPTAVSLERIYLQSLEIVEKYRVKLGPRCIPCQHNTLTLPDGSRDYYYS